MPLASTSHVALVAAALTLSAGCESNGPAIGTVTGQVTHESKPVTPGTIIFENPSLALISLAELDSQGRYLLPDIQVAQYTVSVQPPEPILPSESDGTVEEIKAKLAKVKIPDPKNIPRPVRSTQTSPLRANVVEGEQEFNFELADAARS
ncbi:MAG: hypothetical protein WD851_20625 [Pirellulales bacterium]